MSKASQARRAEKRHGKDGDGAPIPPPAFRDPLYWVNEGNRCLAAGDISAAAGCYRSAIQLDPRNVLAYHALGTCYWSMSQFFEAERHFRLAVEIDPKFWPAVDMLAYRHVYSGANSAAESFAEHVAIGRRIEKAAGAPRSSWPNARDPERKIRVGYVSGDLRSHSIAAFLEPLLRNHDRTRFEIHAFSGTPTEDATTARLKSHVDTWHMILGKSDVDAAKIVADARVDILIDLAGHTTLKALGLFARKPSPVSATWLGYPASTGLETIDYRIVDGMTDPAPWADAYVSERRGLIRLPNGFLCYQPQAGVPDVVSPPSSRGEPFTFGSFNLAAKLSQATLETWGRILLAVPSSRLVLKSVALATVADRFWIDRSFRAQGVDPRRVVILLPVAKVADHWACYSQIDVALDPTPYNGTTTSFESLHMGCPIIALAGDRHSARVTSSLMRRLGLDDFVAETPERYVEIAAEKAGHPERLVPLRSALRGMTRAALCDEKRFAKEFEEALRAAWATYCRETR